MHSTLKISTHKQQFPNEIAVFLKQISIMKSRIKKEETENSWIILYKGLFRNYKNKILILLIYVESMEDNFKPEILCTSIFTNIC